jgi:hypothetical protein
MLTLLSNNELLILIVGVNILNGYGNKCFILFMCSGKNKDLKTTRMIYE